MRLADLPPLLRDEPGLTRALGDPAARLAISENARPIAIAALARLSHHRPLLVATPTGTMAGQLADDLAQFVDDPGDVVVLPAWETLPFERLSPSVETMGRRLEVLWRLRRVPRSLPSRDRRQHAGAAATDRSGGADHRADRRSATATWSIPTSWSVASSTSATGARSWSSTAASSPAEGRSSTCSRRPATLRCGSTCGATRSTG